MGITVEHIGRPTDGKSIGEWVKAATIRTAEEALRQDVGRGFDTAPLVVTDGTPRRDYNQVKPFGKIEFIANTALADAVRWALTELQKRSPVLTGRYVSSHVVMIDGAEVQGNIWRALRAVKAGQRVQIVNPQPYARKIEGATARKATKKRYGREKRAASSRQAKSGVYRPVLRALVARYGKSIFVDYKLVNLDTGVKVWGKQGGGKSATRVQRDQVFPALQFFSRGEHGR